MQLHNNGIHQSSFPTPSRWNHIHFHPEILYKNDNSQVIHPETVIF